ncbi:MAG: undecaprenyl-phosphate galactose phosphotransferase WbaP [Planctomycetaceae bacterium]|nr:undecaprenyl-phosphate galactose phosphotransferase WbaP [Planctomycetaceae bacterium]
MADKQGLVHPLVSVEALSTLTSVNPVASSDTEEGTKSFPDRATGIRHIRQVAMTAAPLVFADVSGLAGCYAIGAAIDLKLVGHPWSLAGFFNNTFGLCLGFVLLAFFLKLYPASGANPVRELRDQCRCVIAAFLIMFALNGLAGEVTSNEVVASIIAFPLAILLLPVSRFAARRLCAPCRWWGEHVVVIGSGPHAQAVFRFLQQAPQRGLKPLGVVDASQSDYWSNNPPKGMDFLGTTSELLAVCRQRHCNWVIAALTDRSEHDVHEILIQGSLIPNLVVLTSRLLVPTLWAESFDAAGLVGIHIRDALLLPFHRAAKRLVDVSVAGFFLLATLPFLPIVAVWIRWASPGPIFYRHPGRIGRYGRTFGALKIRTMVTDADRVLEEHLASDPEAGAEWERDLKLKQDPRIIKGIGHFLRQTSLDELPQLWNVIVGDMSLVGPRPIYTHIEVSKFRERYPLYLRVRPGLTGLWQVSGRNNTTYEDRVQLDAYYVRNWSLWLDYYILLRTFRTLILREGAF